MILVHQRPGRGERGEIVARGGRGDCPVTRRPSTSLLANVDGHGRREEFDHYIPNSNRSRGRVKSQVKSKSCNQVTSYYLSHLFIIFKNTFFPCIYSVHLHAVVDH